MELAISDHFLEMAFDIHFKFDNTISSLTLSPSTEVQNVKVMIKENFEPDLRDYSADRLILVRVFPDKDFLLGVDDDYDFSALIKVIRSKLNVETTRMETENFPEKGFFTRIDSVAGKVMKSAYTINEYHLNRESDPDCVDFIVVTPKKRKRSESPTSEILTFNRDLYQKTILAKMSETLPSPSVAARTEALNALNAEKFIFDGRLGGFGLPATWYCKLFSEFKERVDKTPDVTLEQAQVAEDLVLDMKGFSKSERDRKAEFKYVLRKIIRKLRSGLELEDFKVNKIEDECAMAIVSNYGDVFDALLLLVEVKNELGTTNCEGTIQSEVCVAKFWCQPEVDKVVSKCCCPTIIVQLIGPFLRICGSVVIEGLHVEPLLEFTPLFSVNKSQEHVLRIAHIFECLTCLIEELDRWYSNVLSLTSVSSELQRFYPYVREVDVGDEKLTEPTFDCRPFEFQNMMKAKLVNARGQVIDTVVVKISSWYGYRVHEFAAERDFAPKIYYHSETDIPGYHFTVMQYIEGETLFDLRHQVVDETLLFDLKNLIDGKAFDDLRANLVEMHNANFVFGDLRDANVIFCNEKLYLIDFDWAGDAGIVSYPFNVETTKINRPKRVKGMEQITSEDDLWMFEKLKVDFYTKFKA
ncbi:hypothetical protein HK098_003574 [Nowakowskiella sp. JEL0407]|nr:hypothetical protein HK098_003574 [Nowakowskiella sp. JEL0407]